MSILGTPRLPAPGRAIRPLISYNWNTGVGISVESGSSVAATPIEVFGSGPTGSSFMNCTATNTATGANNGGSMAVTVQDEYVIIKNPDYNTIIGTFVVASNAITATYNGQSITFTVTGSQSQTVGVSSSVEVNLSIIEDFLGASASSTKTIENTTAVGSSTATGPPASAVIAGMSYWLTIAPIYNDYTGTLQTWGTSSLLSTGQWTNQQLGSPAYDEKVVQSQNP